MIQKFVQQLKESVQESLDGVHTCIPGVIVSFDADKCTAIVKPIGKIKRPDGQKVDYPQIAKVPLHFQQSSTQESCICFGKAGGRVLAPLFRAGTGCVEEWRRGFSRPKA